MDYYGVTMHIGNLGGNFFLNQFILAAVEFPAKISSMLLLNRIGRRKLHTLIMIIGGGALLCTIFPVLYGKEGKIDWLFIVPLAVQDYFIHFGNQSR